MSDPSPLVHPTTVGGRFRIVRPLGAGAWGTVYEAVHGWTQQRVALKLLHPQHCNDRQLTRRFIEEARAASRVSHPSIVRVLDVGEDPEINALYIVQEYLEGFDLATFLDRERRISAHDALDILLPVMGALVALHAAGVVHRDLKPSNIFLARDPTRGLVPTVIDFGIARLLDGSGSVRTATGELLGTPEYMAPEQVRGETNVDHRVDVWAIGVLIYECIVGQTPFFAPDLPAIFSNVLTLRAPRLDFVAPGTSKALAAIVAHALEPDREARIPTMWQFLQALLDCPRVDDGITGRDFLLRHKDSFPDMEALLDGPTRLDVREPEVRPAGSPKTVWLLAQYAQQADTEPKLAGPITVFDEGVPPSMVEPGSTSPPTARPAPRALTAPGPNPVERQSPPEPRPPSSHRMWIAAGVGFVGLLLVAGLGFVLGSPRTYQIDLEVVPSTATIALDGASYGTARLTRELPRDGQPHRLELRAPGHRRYTIWFVDRGPPSPIRMTPEGLGPLTRTHRRW